MNGCCGVFLHLSEKDKSLGAMNDNNGGSRTGIVDTLVLFLATGELGQTNRYTEGRSGTAGIGTTSSLLTRLKTEATLRTLREILRPRPRAEALEKVVGVGGIGIGPGVTVTVTVVALSDLPIARTGSSAAVMVFRRR